MKPLPDQDRIVAELEVEAVKIDAVRSPIPTFETKIRRALDRVWGNGA